MKKNFIALLALGFMVLGCQQNQKKEVILQTEVSSVPEKLLRHVVLFKFKDESSPEDIKKVEDAFRGLATKIEAIYDFEWGTNNSPEGLEDGFTHCFLVTFKDEEGRAEYLPHPDHEAFVDILRPHLDKVLVVDYWTQN
ncbi:MAG: Dabb family protein [Cyclobacteriaceae bacterium]|nr:Dabb family protein [Cyclobacteriaceae bacterium]